MAQRHLQILITAKNNAQKQLSGMRNQVEKMQPAFQKMALVGTSATAGITAGIGKAVNEARKAQDIQSLFNLAFSESEERAKQMVDRFSQEFGRAESKIQETVANTAFQ